MDLTKKKCVACEGGIPPLKGERLKKYQKMVKGWKTVRSHQIEKGYKFKDFKTALKFVDKIGSLAEKEGHHPDIFLAWGKVKVTLWTHAVNGLSENDFIMAAKIDKLS
ncbi:4a-hydroxytetrahydrobiopterin dehydratase [Candidatus Woesearchaeota archaeon CG10_big_fil_rev_8_21_14_0_10_45_16]|nr:MAG: 4a-hydroxytetrahydrobiopterin dehydratase [Candidatus Woesearchaeota archaeon CG10_big_fil_rev_8_21_14_0_10_45_16]